MDTRKENAQAVERAFETCCGKPNNKITGGVNL